MVCHFMPLGRQKGEKIISNEGSTNPGSRSKRLCHRKELVEGLWETTRYYKVIKRPSMVEEFYSCFGIIDVHDHLCQGSLAMEREGYTHKWWHRAGRPGLKVTRVSCHNIYILVAGDSIDWTCTSQM